LGHRLTRIYTRTGDDGSTSLGDGRRVAKNDPRVEAIGAVDELNSVLGLLTTESLPPDIGHIIADIQHELFELGGELSVPGRTVITEAQVTRIENALDRLNEPLPPLKEFILPGGGGRAAALAHVARAVCRRAERRVIALAQTETVNTATLRYLNRLSDLLFVVARALNRLEDRPDVLWQPGKTR
jgi:cob(I)alamin adenosyltransferase